MGSSPAWRLAAVAVVANAKVGTCVVRVAHPVIAPVIVPGPLLHIPAYAESGTGVAAKDRTLPDAEELAVNSEFLNCCVPGAVAASIGKAVNNTLPSGS